jgi:large subunit ribosomal protein L10
MPTEKKAQHIDKLEKEFSKASIGILTDYRGLKTPEVNGLRRKLQESDGDYKVVKNTLARKAAEKQDRSEISSLLEGPTAVAFGYGDISQLAKAFSDYVRTSKINLNVKGGFMGNRLLSVEEITTLASLPPRDVLLGQVVGGIKGPLYMLVSALSGPVRGLQNVLQARIKQLEDNN